MGINIVSAWQTLLLLNIRTEACNTPLQKILVAHAKWELIRLPKPTQCTVEAIILYGQIHCVIIAQCRV